LRQVLDEFRGKMIPILHQHGVIHAAVFGSFARGEQKENSVLDLVALKLELEERLRRKIDVVTYNGLHPAIREKVLEEQMIII
jgi:predicted nucleotidyltransferase